MNSFTTIFAERVNLVARITKTQKNRIISTLQIEMVQNEVTIHFETPEALIEFCDKHQIEINREDWEK